MQLSQPVFEAELKVEAESLAKSTGMGRLNYGHTVESLDFQSKKVWIRNQQTNERYSIQPTAVVAADGARSLIRQACGLELNGKSFLESFASVHFSSPQLGEQLRASKSSAMLSFVFNADIVAAVVVVHDARGKGSFVVHLPFFPPSENWQEFEKTVPGLIRKCLVGGSSPVGPCPEFKIESIKSWGMHCTLANRFVDKSGWVALMGDAAHQFPPSGGFGVNMGIAEAENLAFKLASCVDLNNPELVGETLRLYEAERRPIARATLDVAFDNYNRGLAPARALGLYRPTATLVSSLLQPIGKDAFRVVAGAAMGLAVSRRSASEDIKKVVEVDQAALPLYFPNVDIGANVFKPSESLKNNVKFVHVNTLGRSVKHVWLRDVRDTPKWVSTVDLASPFETITELGERANSLKIKRTLFVRDGFEDGIVMEDFRVVVRVVEGAALAGEVRGKSGSDSVFYDVLNEFFERDVFAVAVRPDGFVVRIWRKEEGNLKI